MKSITPLINQKLLDSQQRPLKELSDESWSFMEDLRYEYMLDLETGWIMAIMEDILP